jgi:hypothetical protein
MSENANFTTYFSSDDIICNIENKNRDDVFHAILKKPCI